MGSVWRCLKYMGMAGSAVVAGLTAHELLALVVLAVLVAVLVLAVLVRGMLRWIISSGDRSDVVIRMILALRGDGGSLTQEHSAGSAQPDQPKGRLAWRRKC
jgi:hypothetical protein